MLVFLKHNSLKMFFFFWSHIYVLNQNDWQNESLSRQMVILVCKNVHWPVVILSPSIPWINLYPLISLLLFRWIVIYLVHGTIQH